MRRLLLATVATAALAFPAFAQTQTPPAHNPPQATQQTQPQATKPVEPQAAKQAQSQPKPSGQEQAGMNTREINPANLSQPQIKEIQQALNKEGFSSGHVDGIWGPDTSMAVEHFQKTKGMTANGKLDEQTLSALNLKMGDLTQNHEATAANNEAMKGAATTAKDSAQGKTGTNAPAATGEQNANAKTGTKPETQAKTNNHETGGKLQNGAQPAAGGKTP